MTRVQLLKKYGKLVRPNLSDWNGCGLIPVGYFSDCRLITLRVPFTKRLFVIASYVRSATQTSFSLMVYDRSCGAVYYRKRVISRVMSGLSLRG
jgi:hypothetical protein